MEGRQPPNQTVSPTTIPRARKVSPRSSVAGHQEAAALHKTLTQRVNALMASYRDHTAILDLQVHAEAVARLRAEPIHPPEHVQQARAARDTVNAMFPPSLAGLEYPNTQAFAALRSQLEQDTQAIVDAASTPTTTDEVPPYAIVDGEDPYASPYPSPPTMW